MDPNVFFGALLSALIAAHQAHAGVVCDRRGFCVEQPQFQNRLPPPMPPVFYPPPVYPPPPVAQAPRPQEDALGAKVKKEIYELCGRHPEEVMCQDLDKYLEQHPGAR